MNSLIGIKTDILSRTVLELSQVIVQILDIRLNDLSHDMKILAELSSVLLQISGVFAYSRPREGRRFRGR